MPLFRPTICEINLSALRHNYRELKKCAEGREVLAVVKANAYGHGAVNVARALASEGASCLGVATVEEGIELRKAGVLIPILCLGGAFGAQPSDLLEHALTPVVFNEESIRRLEQAQLPDGVRLGVHLKVDTGMGRLGALPEEAERLLSLLKNSPTLELRGVMTHFARADEPDEIPTAQQFKKIRQVEEVISRLELQVPFLHVANSAALIDRKLEGTQMVRPGIALYGSYPHPRFREKIDLKPVMTWKTEVISLKKFPQGTPLSYGATFKTTRPSLIAVIAVGYADGYSRLLSNRGEVLIHGKRAPVVGRVCMDLTLVDVTDLPEVNLGDEAVLLGEQGTERITAEELAEKTSTISYEIFCSVSARVPRIAMSVG